MPTKFVYPYGPSHSASQLVEALDGRLIKRENSRYRYRPGHTVINWGSSACPAQLRGVPVVNSFDRVSVATSKLQTFAALRDARVRVPDWTTQKAIAEGWLNEGIKVVGRDLDRGSQGRGIVVYRNGSPLGDHRFYVKYFKKNREFRVHVVNGQVIFEQEKLKKNGAENADKYIRSHDRGWCFAFHHLNDKPVPQEVRATAIESVTALGLHFGAVDLGWHNRNGHVTFEVNTAPGIEETSLTKYTEAFQ